MSNSEKNIYQKIRDAVEYIKTQSDIQPRVGLILGSGLGNIADHITARTEIPYENIPHFSKPSIQGHQGKLILGDIGGHAVACLQGRYHFYEGHTMEDVVFPTRTLSGLGIHTLLLTNAAGGINEVFAPGDLMLITDHINLMGDNPLKGPNLSELGPRFPDLSNAYEPKCTAHIRDSAKELGIKLQEGVYSGLAGPTYETPAEVRMLRTLGADAVGMSTVPETIAANHLGVRVCGISCITNLAAGLSLTELNHEEVVVNSNKAAEKMLNLIIASLPKIATVK